MNKTEEAKREQFLQDHYLEWNAIGQEYRKKRNELGLSLDRVANLLGTSASRVRRFEIGEPISMAEHLKKTYTLLFDHIELHADLLDLRNNHRWRG